MPASLYSQCLIKTDNYRLVCADEVRYADSISSGTRLYISSKNAYVTSPRSIFNLVEGYGQYFFKVTNSANSQKIAVGRKWVTRIDSTGAGKALIYIRDINVTFTTTESYTAVVDSAIACFQRAVSSGLATLSDGDYGDVVVSGGGLVLTVDKPDLGLHNLADGDFSVVGDSTALSLTNTRQITLQTKNIDSWIARLLINNNSITLRTNSTGKNSRIFVDTTGANFQFVNGANNASLRIGDSVAVRFNTSGSVGQVLTVTSIDGDGRLVINPKTGGTGTANCEQTLTKNSHGFRKWTPIYWNGSTWARPTYDSIIPSYIVVDSTSANTFKVANCGNYASTLTSGLYYYKGASPGYSLTPTSIPTPLFEVAQSRLILQPLVGFSLAGGPGGVNSSVLADTAAAIRADFPSGVSDGDKGDITITSGVWAIDNNAVTSAKIASQTVDSLDIKNRSITTVKVADDAITSPKIATGAVGSDELASSGVTAGSYTAADITVDADGRITAASNGGGSSSLIEVPIFLFMGESNSGGYALNSSATSNELAPRKEIVIWNNIARTFQNLDIGTNNLSAHAGLESYYGLTHGFELELSNQIRDSFGLTYAYLLKAGQGGSTISQWDDGDTYQITLENRIDSVTTALAARGQKPKWIIWVSFGINDAIASTSASTWKTAVLSWFTRVRTLCGGGTSIPIVMTRIMRTNASYQAIDDKISEIAAEQDFVSAANIADASLRDANHWDYAGMKLIANRMAAITLDSFGLVGNFKGRDAVSSSPSDIISVSSSGSSGQKRITWETRTNTTDSGNGTLTLSGSLDAGAVGDTIDATQDFQAITRWDATTLANNEAVVFALDDSTNTNYNWTGARRYYVATFYQFGGTLYASIENAGTGSPTATNTGFSVTANQWARLLKSGNDVLLQTSSDSLSWTTRHTYTSALIGKTNLYTKGIFAVASGTKRIQNASIITPSVSIPAHEYLNFTYAKVYSGSGTPEGVITATVGSIYLRSDGNTGTTFYVKESGTGNTGWVAK